MTDDLPKLREKIDRIDDQIISALAERVKTAQAIGAAKKQNGKPIRDKAREQEVYTRIRAKAQEFGLNKAEVEAVYREIVNMCSSVQE